MRRFLWAAACLLPVWVQAQSPASLQVEGGNTRLRELLATHLDLARALDRAAKHTNDPSEAVDANERERLCQIAPQQARSLLETEGHFTPQHLSIDCAALRFSFDPGPQSRVRKLALRAVNGDEETADQATDAEELAADIDAAGSPLRGRWRRALGLRSGDPFTQDAWAGGKRALLARIRAEGHPLARYRFSDAAVDPEAQAVDLRLHLDLGPAVRIGQVLLEGLVHHEAERARELLALQPGDAYTEQGLLDAQDRLLKSGLFDNVQVELDLESLSGDSKDRMDVRVRVKESPLQQLGIGLGWSSGATASGERITLEHQHRRAFGRPLRSTLKMMLAEDSQSASVELSTHPQARLRRNLIGMSWEREQGASAAPYRQAAFRLGQVYESRPHDRSVSAELLSSRQGLGDLATQADAALLHFNPTWRSVDSVLLPRRGQAWLLQAAAGQARSRNDGIEEKGGLARFHARWYGYWPFSQGRLLATRLEAGQVWARDSLLLPESLLWRVGGDDSVRGYGRRSLGPTREGQAVGGRVSWTGSLEWQQPIPKDKAFGLEGMGWAVFVDAGQAARNWKDAEPAVGGGLGLRWRSPVGLLRVDLARGQEKFQGGWRLHVSLGLSL